MSTEVVNVILRDETIRAEIVEETIVVTQLDEIPITASIVEETIAPTFLEEIIDVVIGAEDILVTVENWCNPCGEIGVGSGALFIVDATGSVGNKKYLTTTVPSNKVLTEVTTDQDEVTIHFLAEGGASYSPVVTLNGVECVNLSEIVGDIRNFTGSFTLEVTETTILTIQSSTGSAATVTIHRTAAAPSIVDLAFTGDYPGNQIEVKEGDAFQVVAHFDPTGTAPTTLYVENSGACKARLIDLSETELNWGTTHYATFWVVIDETGTIPQNLPVVCHAVNSFGSIGPSSSSDDFGSLDGVHTVVCNDAVPTFIDNGVTFPVGQLALKGSEQCTVDIALDEVSTATYSSPNGELSIENPTVVSQEKLVTCLNPGTYNDSQVNFRIVAFRSENATQATFNKIIEVADTAPMVVVMQPEVRLRSSATGASYVILATADQNLAALPLISLLVAVSGEWQGSGFSGGLKEWQRDIVIIDGDEAGVAPWEFDTVPTNRAGIPAIISGEQSVGGFLARNLTLKAFFTEIELGFPVTNYEKLNVGSWEFTGQPLERHPVIDSDPPASGKFTIDAVGGSSHVFRILDTNKTNACSQASIIYGYEELP